MNDSFSPCVTIWAWTDAAPDRMEVGKLEGTVTSLLTSDQFVAGIVAMLAVKNRTRFLLSDTELDGRFQRAFEDLLAAENELDVRTNFSFYVDPQHGDSVCLRETLTAAKEKELIGLNNPTLRTFDVKLSSERAQRYLERNPLPREFFESVVDHHFPA